MSNLYLVTVSYDVIVAADDAADAEREALANKRRIPCDQDPDMLIVNGPLEGIDQIPREWRGCLPYGGDGDTPIEGYFGKGTS